MRKMEEIDVIFLWRILKKHWSSITLSALLCSAAAFAICRFVVAPVYKAEVSLFAWNETSKSPTIVRRSESGGNDHSNVLADDSKLGISISDINLGNQLVNDYKELINSRYVQNKVEEILNEKLPAEKHIKFTFEASLPRQTRFMKVAVYSTSATKAETAAAVIADVFIESVGDLMNISRVKVVDKAKVVGIVSPKTFAITLLAFLLGGGGLFGVFVAFSLFHHTLHNAEIVTAELNLPTIGKIGEIQGRQDEKSKLVCLPNRDSDRQYRFDHIVENFLLLQTNLHYSLAQKHGAQIILLSSALPDDGKTFVATNLGLTLSSSGKRVLLINCDLRQVAFDHFDVPRSPGLVNYLLGENKIEEIIHKNVLNSVLSMINNGPIPPNPAYMLEMLQKSALFSSISADYDYIILDAPPLQNMADALLLSKLADGVIIVANGKRTPVGAVRDAVAQLRKINVNILGVVLNHLPPDSNGYGYGYGYGNSEKES